MTELKMTGFGATLRQRREELKLSLDDLAASTRIRKTYLLALEEENLRALPGAAYTIGFLRIYARQLGLPVEPLLSSLAGTEEQFDRPDLPLISGEQTRAAKTSKGKRKSVRLLILLMTLLSVAAAYLYFKSEVPPPRQVPVEIAQREKAPPLETAPQPQVASPAPVSTPTPAPVQGQPSVAFVELPVLPPGGAIVRMLPVAAGMMKVSLDKQELREYQLQPDQSLNWKVTGSLSCELSAPGLIRVWINQQEVAVTEYPAFVLKGAPQQERLP